MRFSTFDKGMYRVAFEGERHEILPMLDFQKFIFENSVRDKLLNHPLGPSSTWKAWADETYLGYSTGRIMLQSGHRFGPAEHTHPQSMLPWRRDRFNPEKQIDAFKTYYPQYVVPTCHRSLFDAHPGAYLRAAEAFLLSDATASRMIEIGAGNCVHVAYRHLLNPEMETVIVDLPESMFAGYCLLRLMGIDVALPHEDRRAKVTMRLPYQRIPGEFDFAFNMSSFQEMEIDTVRKYIELVRSVTNGKFQHINLLQSRQHALTRVDNYGVIGVRSAVPYHSSLAKTLVMCCEIENSDYRSIAVSYHANIAN